MNEQKLRGALERLEWHGRDSEGRHCPVCYGGQMAGHVQHCWLKAALAASPATPTISGPAVKSGKPSDSPVTRDPVNGPDTSPATVAGAAPTEDLEDILTHMEQFCDSTPPQGHVRATIACRQIIGDFASRLRAVLAGTTSERLTTLLTGLRGLRELSDSATSGPWCWDNRGEKCNDIQIGTALNEKDEYYTGEITDEIADVTYVDDVAEVTGGQADAALIVACVNFVRDTLVRTVEGR